MRHKDLGFASRSQKTLTSDPCIMVGTLYSE